MLAFMWGMIISSMFPLAKGWKFPAYLIAIGPLNIGMRGGFNHNAACHYHSGLFNEMN